MKVRMWYSVWLLNSEFPSSSELWNTLRPAVGNVVVESQTEPNGFWWLYCDAATRQPLISVRRHLPGHQDFDRRRVTDRDAIRLPNEAAPESVFTHLRDAVQIINITPMPSWLWGERRQARICEQLCGYCAHQFRGLIQADSAGFFDAVGCPIFPRQSRHRLQTGL